MHKQTRTKYHKQYEAQSNARCCRDFRRRGPKSWVKGLSVHGEKPVSMGEALGEIFLPVYARVSGHGCFDAIDYLFTVS